MYQLTRQLDLLDSINWHVVKATPSQPARLQSLVKACRIHLQAEDVFTDNDKLAHALVDFTSLVEVVAEVGEIPYQANRWLLVVAEKLPFYLAHLILCKIEGFHP